MSVNVSAISTENVFKFKTTCYFRNGKKRIHLLSESYEHISSVMKLIQEYTKIVDPNATLRCHKVKPVEDSALQSEGFTHSVNIHDILPRMVAQFYGKSAFYGNCHGSALVTSGLFPIMTSRRPFDSFTLNRTEPIALENIRMGDLVSIGGGAHSFVFLSHEFCFSTNGLSNPLELHRTSDVLKFYRYPTETLKVSNPLMNVTVLRKREHLIGFDEFIPTLMEMFRLMEILVPDPEPRSSSRWAEIDPLDQNLRRIAFSTLQRSELSAIDKETVLSIYHVARGQMYIDSCTMPFKEALNLLIATAFPPPMPSLENKVQVHDNLSKTTDASWKSLSLIVAIFAAIFFLASGMVKTRA